MDERHAQNSRLEELLPEMEAFIRKGVPIDIPQAVNKHSKEYEKMTSHERDAALEFWIEDARGREPSYDSQVARAFLKELSDRYLEREEVPPWRLVEFVMEVHAGRIREKPKRGRPRRSGRAKYVIFEAYNILIEARGYTAAEARREVASWLNTRPAAVAQIVSDWN